MGFNWLKAAKAEDNGEAEEAREKATRENVWQRDSDLLSKMKQQEQERATWWSTIFLAYGSLGVIYGDIGTSIIYVYSQIFVTVGSLTKEDPHALEQDILGAVSLIFWALTLIALVKYVGVVLRANDTGEGGTVALYAQLCRTMGISPFGTMRLQDHQQVLALQSAASFPNGKRPNIGEHRHRSSFRSIGSGRMNGSMNNGSMNTATALPPLDIKLSWFKPWSPPFGFAVMEGLHVIRYFRRTLFAQRMLLVVTMIATGLVIGDGVLMPAFSVNSAISGIEQHTSGEIDSAAIVGISVAIVVILFLSQHVGTQKIAFTFSPIIILWLLANLGIALYNLHEYGAVVFKGLNPQYIVIFFQKFKRKGWEMLGGVMLSVSGTETMFAAMGHFSQPAVALAFGCFAYPCLVLTYLGQAAYLLHHPDKARTTFWSSIPEPIFWPMLVLATLAAIVASQAVITGTFSIVRQATALGVFPKLRIVHTDAFVEGQIFIPSINYILMLLCIAVIAGFGGNNDRLGDAYGVAVMAVMLVTTVMVSLIMLVKWDVSLLMVVPFFLLFLVIEGVFLSANLFKVPSGGWFPLAVAAVVCFIMTVWWLGQFFRRKMMLRTGKEQDATKIFTIYNGAPNSPKAEMMMRRSKPGLAVSEHGSGTDLASMPLTAAGYPSRTSPPRFRSLLSPTAGGGGGGGMGKKHELPMRQSSSPLMSHAGVVSGGGAGGPDPSPATLSARPTLTRTSAASTGSGRCSGAGAAAESVGGVDGVDGAAVCLSEVNVRSGSGSGAALNRVRFGSSEGTGPPASPTRTGGGWSNGGGAGGNPQTTSLRSLQRPSRALTTASELVLPPRPTLALAEHPYRPLAKLSGLGLYYSDSPMGVPHIMRHFLKNADALHEAGILLTVRFLPMPTIKNAERLLVRAVQGLPNYYQVVARYGYQDIVDHSEKFVQQIITTIIHKLELKAGLMYQGLEDDFIHEIEGDYVEDGVSETLTPTPTPADAASRVFGLEIVHESYVEEEKEELSTLEAEIPTSDFVSRFALAAVARIKVVATAPDAADVAIDALGAARALVDTANDRVVYYLGRAFTRAAPRRSLIHSITIGGLFRTLEMFSYQDSEAWLIPVDNMVELGMALEI